jgi:long-chain acyl-CoA synthetase
MFRATAAQQGDRALVHYFDRSITAGEIDRMSDGLAVALQQCGTEPVRRFIELSQRD